uniref:Brd103 n=1 Tax=Arundo donax TaxID=35708 RepID=A0A0A9G2Y6_ARUDO
MSARLRNVQPEVNLSQSYEVLKRQKKSTENEQGMTKDETARDERSTEDVDLSKPTSPEEAPKEPDSNGTLKETDNSSAEATPEVPAAAPDPMETDNGEVATMTAGDDLLGQLETVKQRFMELTAGYGVPQLERLYSRMMKGAIELTSKENNEDHRRLVRYLLTFVENSDNL